MTSPLRYSTTFLAQEAADSRNVSTSNEGRCGGFTRTPYLPIDRSKYSDLRPRSPDASPDARDGNRGIVDHACSPEGIVTPPCGETRPEPAFAASTVELVYLNILSLIHISEPTRLGM